MEDNTIPADELPPDLRKLTINIESIQPDDKEHVVSKIEVFGTSKALMHLQALISTQVDAVNAEPTTGA